MTKIMLSAGALVAAALCLAALSGAIKMLCLWWAVATQVGHKAAAVLLVPPAILLLLCFTLSKLASIAWQALCDESREQELAERRELQNRRDDLELSQVGEEERP